MTTTRNINAPKADAITSSDVTERPFAGGALLFKEMPVRIVEDLGMMFPKSGGKKKIHFALCECHCGKVFKTRLGDVKNGSVNSCGCYRISSNGNNTQGLSKHPLYAVWKSMRKRCYHSNLKEYTRYGGRGISICDEWHYNFKSFYDWSLSHGYSNDLQIDRRDNDGDYEPANCRWVSHSANQQNKPKTKRNTSGYKGVFKHMTGKWGVMIMADKKSYFLGCFSDVVEAAITYDDAAKRLHGEYACLNFTENK